MTQGQVVSSNTESNPVTELLKNGEMGQKESRSTLYRPAVMRAKSTRPPMELPTMSGTGL